MSGGAILLAEFADPASLVQAARRARAAGWRQLDAHTPFAVEELAEALGLGPGRLRPLMLLAGLLGAGFVAAYQYASGFHLHWWPLAGSPLSSLPGLLP